jgi:hypothetical protein
VKHDSEKTSGDCIWIGIGIDLQPGGILYLEAQHPLQSLFKKKNEMKRGAVNCLET